MRVCVYFDLFSSCFCFLFSFELILFQFSFCGERKDYIFYSNLNELEYAIKMRACVRMCVYLFGPIKQFHQNKRKQSKWNLPFQHLNCSQKWSLLLHLPHNTICSSHQTLPQHNANAFQSLFNIFAIHSNLTQNFERNFPFVMFGLQSWWHITPFHWTSRFDTTQATYRVPLGLGKSSAINIHTARTHTHSRSLPRSLSLSLSHQLLARSPHSHESDTTEKCTMFASKALL